MNGDWSQELLKSALSEKHEATDYFVSPFS